MSLWLVFRNIRPYISTELNTMQYLMSLHQALQGNKRKTKSPARHRETHRSRQVRLGCEVMEDRVLIERRAPRLPLHSPRSCRRDYSAQRSQLDRGVHQNSGGDHPTHCEQWINAGRCPGGPVVHGHGGFRDADQPGLDPGGRRDRLPDPCMERRHRGERQPEQQLHRLGGHRLESQHHLQPRCGRLQRGRHDLGEFPERNHIIQTHRSLGSVFHGHGCFSDADQPGLGPGGRRDRLPGR